VVGLHHDSTGSLVNLYCQCLSLIEYDSLQASEFSGQLMIDMLHSALFVISDVRVKHGLTLL